MRSDNLARRRRRNLSFEMLESRRLLAAEPLTAIALNNLSISGTTGEKPQSKVWFHEDTWWSVLPRSNGTFVWRLDGATWTPVLQLSTKTSIDADAKQTGDVTHILLYDGTSSQLASVEYVPGSPGTYQMWASRPNLASVTLSSGVETATIDVDSLGRMWLASDASSTIQVRYSDAPYTTWSAPITIATGISSDDISVITALPNGTIGVMWSNQNTERFGFKSHVDGAPPTEWSADEVPGSQSAVNNGAGMADDHLNVAIASDSTLYAAVKTGYAENNGLPVVGLLVRRPSGVWDDLYAVDTSRGTRGIVQLNEATDRLLVIYTASTGGNNIVYQESSLSSIDFGPRRTLMTGSLNDASTAKENYTSELLVIASTYSGGTARGVRLVEPIHAGITVTPTSGVATTEAGGTATFTVALATRPSADVTIGLSSSDTSEGTPDVESLVFTPANWDVSQTVTVTGVDDADPDGNVPYRIVTAAALSTDSGYSGLSAADFSLTNLNDEPGVSVTVGAGVVTTEAGGSIAFGVALNTAPTQPVTIPLSSSEASEGTANAASLVFTPADWSTPKLVTVSGVDDRLDDDDQPYRIVFGPAVSDDPRYSGFDAADVSLTNADNDTAGVTVTPVSGLVTTEAGGTASFTFVLDTQPTADVTIGVSSNDTTEGTVATAELIFTSGDWNIPKSVTVSGVDDPDPDGDVPYTIVTSPASSADPKYAGLNPSDVTVTNLSDEAPPFFIFASAGPSTIRDRRTLSSRMVITDNFSIQDLNVELTIGHTRDSDLDVFLIGPNGRRVELFTDVGGSGDHFLGTTLDDEATQSIRTGGAPFTGTFQPEAVANQGRSLKYFYGRSAAGSWTLEITDDSSGQTGTLDNWSLIITPATSTATSVATSGFQALSARSAEETRLLLATAQASPGSPGTANWRRSGVGSATEGPGSRGIMWAIQRPAVPSGSPVRGPLSSATSSHTDAIDQTLAALDAGFLTGELLSDVALALLL